MQNIGALDQVVSNETIDPKETSSSPSTGYYMDIFLSYLLWNCIDVLEDRK